MQSNMHPGAPVAAGVPPPPVVTGPTMIPPTTIVYAAPPSQQKVENYNCKAAIRIGISLIVIGVLLIVCSVRIESTF